MFGTNATGAAADNFAKAFAAQNGATAQPIAGANYAYDAVLSLALAMDKAGTTDGPAVIAAMKQVTNPPGTPCDDYASCLKGIQAGTKIKMDGSSGDLIYNQYQNVFGPYGAFQADATTGRRPGATALATGPRRGHSLASLGAPGSPDPRFRPRRRRHPVAVGAGVHARVLGDQRRQPLAR